MDFQKPLDDLEGRIAEVKSSVTAAEAETKDELQRHVARAQESAEVELEEARQHPGAGADRARSAWEQMRDDARARASWIRTKAQIRGDELDARNAAQDADIAEAEAAAAIDYAAWAIKVAELAILDAHTVREHANEKAGRVKAAV